MKDTDEIARRIDALPEPHREHAVKRIEHMLETVEVHAAEYHSRNQQPAHETFSLVAK